MAAYYYNPYQAQFSTTAWTSNVQYAVQNNDIVVDESKCDNQSNKTLKMEVDRCLCTKRLWS